MGPGTHLGIKRKFGDAMVTERRPPGRGPHSGGRRARGPGGATGGVTRLRSSEDELIGEGKMEDSEDNVNVNVFLQQQPVYYTGRRTF